MKSGSKLKLLGKILKQTHTLKIITGFLLFVFILAFVFDLLEQEIHDYWEGLWYCYVNLFTIGFGDIVPVHPVSRILSVLLTTYATIVIALVTAAIVQFYQEYSNLKFKTEYKEDLKMLAHLERYSKQDLTELSNRLRENYSNIGS